MSAPFSAIDQITKKTKGIVQGSGPEFASLVPGVDPYCQHIESSGYPGGNNSMAQPQTRLFRRSIQAPAQCAGGDNPQHCQFGSLGRNALARSRFPLERLLSDEMPSHLTEH